VEERWALEYLSEARVAHLACSTKTGKPLVVPICFTFYGSRIYTAIDEKSKSTKQRNLRRISNIVENPRVCFVVDRYSEDWTKLHYVLINGSATIIRKGKEFAEAIRSLREKYPQYHLMKLEARPIIRITPLRVIAWKQEPTEKSRTVKTNA
jgi:PPOX class probable F420-dependent enzyme